MGDDEAHTVGATMKLYSSDSRREEKAQDDRVLFLILVECLELLQPSAGQSRSERVIWGTAAAVSHMPVWAKPIDPYQQTPTALSVNAHHRLVLTLCSAEYTASQKRVF